MHPRAVTQEISRQFAYYGSWSLTADDVRRLLQIDHVRFYQDVYAAAREAGGTIELSSVTARFDPDKVGELVDLLELFCGREAEQEMARVGAFIPHPARVELTQTLLDCAGEQARQHRIDRPSFRGMLRVFGVYEKARDTYFSEFFSREELVQEAIRRFVQDNAFEMEQPAAETARAVVDRLFRSHILEIETLLADVGVALFEVAVEEGYAQRPEDESAEDGSAEKDYDTHAGDGRHAVAWACDVLELDPQRLSVGAVKRSYKKLMLRYHPDINPRGLRTAQRINRAYTLLIQYSVQRA